ncbi:MAG TPA: hypothetical protein VGE93_00550 [Bryobacteraceae bacterium]
MPDRESGDRSAALHAEAKKVRADALRTRIMATTTFCEVAERQAKWESVEAARQTLEKAWERIEESDRHIQEPNHVTPESATMLRSLLRKLEKRAAQIEANLEQQPDKAEE